MAPSTATERADHYQRLWFAPKWICTKKPTKAILVLFFETRSKVVQVASNSLYSQEWPWIPFLCSFSSQVLDLQAYAMITNSPISNYCPTELCHFPHIYPYPTFKKHPTSVGLYCSSTMYMCNIFSALLLFICFMSGPVAEPSQVREIYPLLQWEKTNVCPWSELVPDLSVLYPPQKTQWHMSQARGRWTQSSGTCWEDLLLAQGSLMLKAGLRL